MKGLIILSFFCIPHVLAEPFEPAAVFNFFKPQFTTIVEYDDNIYIRKDGTVSSFIYYLSPSIAFSTKDGANRYGGEYTLTSSIYSDNQGSNNNDDMTDHQFSLFAYNEFTSKHRTVINFGYNNLHEKRGSGLTESDPFRYNNPLAYNQLNTRFHYQFGRQNAKMRMGVGLSYYDKKYNSYTSETKYNDFDQITFFADSDYQIGDVTYITFDILTSDINYQYRRTSRLLKDNQDTRVFIGLTWRGLNTLNGRARLGYQYKTFDEIEGADFNGNTVDLMINWSPVQRAIYSINLHRTAEDTDTVGDYINNFSGALGWRNEWSNKIDSDIQFAYTYKDYIGADRTDKISNIKASLIYGFSRWLNLSAGYEYSESRSNVDYIGYDQNIFSLSLKVSL